MTSEDILGRSRLFRRLKTGPHGHIVELYAARLAREGLGSGLIKSEPQSH